MDFNKTVYSIHVMVNIIFFMPKITFCNLTVFGPVANILYKTAVTQWDWYCKKVL